METARISRPREARSVAKRWVVFEERKDSMEEIRYCHEDVRRINLRLERKSGGILVLGSCLRGVQ